MLQGEICLCTSRIFVEESIFDDFVKKFVDGAKNLSVGDPKDDNSFMGALISEAHLNKVQVRDGKWRNSVSWWQKISITFAYP